MHGGVAARRRQGLAAAMAAALLAGLGAFGAARSEGADPPELPALKLLAAERSYEVYGSRRGVVRLNFAPVYVAASDGGFRVDVTRPDYGERVAALVDAESGLPILDLPSDVVPTWLGLERFLELTVRDRDGKVVRTGTSRFCPNSYEHQRINDSGPIKPSFPLACTGGGEFPFLRGTVWGIDSGWAVRTRLGKVRLRPGRYTLVVRLGEDYRQLLGTPAEDAEVALKLRVARRSRGGGPGPIAIERRAARAAALRAPTVEQPDAATLPDPAALPLWNLETLRHGRRDLLQFSSSPWNAGPAPLLVEGYRRPGEDVMDAYQFFTDAGGNVVGKAPAGSFEYDRRDGHFHWHFLQLVRFVLLDEETTEIVRSHKESFCIIATNPVDLTVPRAAWNGEGNGTSCGGGDALWIREELPAGWADTYTQAVAGQAFNITNLPNGDYVARLEVNPNGDLYEVSDANNIADRVIHLRGKPGARRVIVEPWMGISK